MLNVVIFVLLKGGLRVLRFVFNIYISSVWRVRDYEKENEILLIFNVCFWWIDLVLSYVI